MCVRERTKAAAAADDDDGLLNLNGHFIRLKKAVTLSARFRSAVVLG